MLVTAQLCDKIEKTIIDEVAKQGFKTISYKDLAKALGMGVHQPNLVSALEAVGSRTYQQRSFFITVLVISAKSQKQCASFWNAVQYNHIYIYNRREFLQSQTEKALEYCRQISERQANDVSTTAATA